MTNQPDRGNAVYDASNRLDELCGVLVCRRARALSLGFLFALFANQLAWVQAAVPETSGGWQKYEHNPVLGGNLGTCFDISVLRDERAYRMYFSWRPKRSVALVDSADGIHWGEPKIVLSPSNSGWEERVNRPGIVKRDNQYHIWYTGQTRDHSYIGYATSPDGVQWQRVQERPVLSPEEPWEKMAVMCPHVIWDIETNVYRMWYSAGEQYEPNAIGYATSEDGVHWKRWGSNPVFRPDPEIAWEKHKVTACQVVRQGDWHVMFYIGFSDEHTAHIGLARSRDGITGWERHPANPIIAPGTETWDGDACYKPYAIFDRQTGDWLLWYNGRRGRSEQIGLALHKGEDLGWPQSRRKTGTTRGPLILTPDTLKSYVDRFNKDDENLNPRTGDWISRTQLKTWENGTWSRRKGGKERGKDYNHSSYCDLVITGLVELRPRDDDVVEVNPLVPPATWDYFCLDNLRYHGRLLTILWDKTGTKYGKGKGLRVFADGTQIAVAQDLRRVKRRLPSHEMGQTE